MYSWYGSQPMLPLSGQPLLVFRRTFSTDTPSLHSWMEGVQEVSLALGHDGPVSVGCPLYNEASTVGGCLVLSSNVVFKG